MTEIDVSREVTGFPGPAVDVEAIERELSNLWRAPDVVELARAAIVPTRTSVLNLVVVAPDRAAAARIARTVGQLSVHHPSRVVIFVTTPHAADPTNTYDARVTTHCYIAPDAQIAPCFEQVIIDVPPSALDIVASVIPSLTLPDLPTFLWWPGQPPFRDPGMVRVTRMVERLVIDSLDFNHTMANLGRLLDLCRHLGEECAVSDLNWARLITWRELIAQFFDAPDHRWALDAVSRVTLHYGHTRGAADNPAQALLFAGWAASRLGWQVVGGERWGKDAIVFTARRPDGRDLTVALHRAPAPRTFNGLLLSAALTADDGHRSGEFRAARANDDLGTIRVSTVVGGAPRMEYAVRCIASDPGSALVHDLRELGRDIQYEDALDAARSYAGALRRQEREGS